MMLHAARRGVVLPDPYCTIASAVRNAEAWKQADDYTLVSDPAEGDVILLRHKGFPIHVGYCINRKWMLHSDPERGSVVERWDGTKWKNRVLGVFRYAI